jgi:Xaa-Pro dipeptidase
VTRYTDHVTHLQRGYDAALAGHGFDAVILCSGAPASRNRFDDQSWPLMPTPAYSHWCPLVEADAYVVVAAGKRPKLVRTVVDDFWETVAPPESDEFLSAFDVVEIAPGHLGDAVPAGKLAVVTRDPGQAPPGDVNPPALLASLDALRTRKTAYEIDCLAEATRRAVLGHRRTESRFRGGEPSELELHLAYLEASGQDDSTTPYKNIVALGAHAAVLHYVAYQRGHVTGDTSLLVDAGAKYLGYGSDITRTYVRGTGEPARRFRDLLARMDALQHDICKKIEVGMEYEALHDASHQLLAHALVDLGIGKASAAELVDRGITRALYPHGLGHSLGVCVHDVGMKLRPPRPDNKYLRNTSVIEAGQVFTIEPGIYLIDALVEPLRGDPALDWGAIDAIRPFGGIRIEDNIAVGAGGIRNLTREAFAA